MNFFFENHYDHIPKRLHLYYNSEIFFLSKDFFLKDYFVCMFLGFRFQWLTF